MKSFQFTARWNWYGVNAFGRVSIASRLTQRLFCGSCISVALFDGDKKIAKCIWVYIHMRFMWLGPFSHKIAALLKIQCESSHYIYEENSTSQPSLWFESKQRCDAYLFNLFRKIDFEVSNTTFPSTYLQKNETGKKEYAKSKKNSWFQFTVICLCVHRGSDSQSSGIHRVEEGASCS